MRVQILHCSANLSDIALDLQLMQALSPPQKFIQTLILAQLKQDVNVLGILEEVFETDDVIVMQTAMNFDFRHQLLLCSALR